MKTSIIYNSKHGTTKLYAEEIAKLLTEKGVENQIASIDEYDRNFLQESDSVLLGCWTHGLMIFAQHPEKAWRNFAADLPEIKGKKLGLFTTYKLATGSMFRKMEACLSGKAEETKLILKSKDGKLSEENTSRILDFIA